MHSIKELSTATGMTYRQIINRIRKKKIQATKVGWVWVINSDEYERLVHEAR